MDVRYQVFVSSTYEDLQEERAEVMQALLELDCMPAGMALFPAASEEQWKWIRRVIDESDYYIVIVGGKYGSTHQETGISYTEMEYDYAVESKKPTIAFIIDKSVNLPENKIEIKMERRQSLEGFRDKVQKRLCKFWINTPDLGAKVSRSITQLIKRDPATGWVRADALTQVDTEENLRLRNRIFELERSLASVEASPINDLTTIAQGDDKFTLRASVNNVFKETSKRANESTLET